MRFSSVRLITADIKRLVSFYEVSLCASAVWLTEDFAELRSGEATLAIGSTKTLAFFGGNDVAEPGRNRSAILEFWVEDVDAAFANVRGVSPEIVQEPKTMPWGNRSLLVRDPDGTLVNFFAPVSDEAKKRFGN